jgi:glyoxylase-like metal-dependent hydrolase (beta-lactamase superfamily II)
MDSSLHIETRAAPPFLKNGYVVSCSQTHEAVLIDPGDETAALLEVVARQRLTVRMILLTHAHVDHVTGVGAAKAALDVPIYLHPADQRLYEAVPSQAAFFGFHADQPPPVDRFYTEREALLVGSLVIRVHHTPGHSPGGVCLEVRQEGASRSHLFVGDTLFAGSVGRTDLPGADHETLMHSIKHVLFSFVDETDVYPGHGPKTTIGQERRTNPFLRD